MTGVEQRVYRRLLRLYPHRFRERFEDALLEVFHAERRARGSRVKFWVFLLGDVASSATRCWWRELRTSGLGWPHWGGSASELRCAIRVLFRERAFSLATVATLALGIGATTAIYTVVDHVLIRPLPYPNAERLVRLWNRHEQAPFFSVTIADFFACRNERGVFDAVGAYREDGLTVALDGEAVRVQGARVTADLFAVLGVEPVRGRGFSMEEDRPGGPRAVVLAHDLWVSRFGGRDLVGETLTVSGEPTPIVGILPAGFEFPQQPGLQVFVPYALEDVPEARGAHFLRVLARLGSGVDLEKARAAMETVSRRLASQSPDTNEGWSVAMMPLRDAVVSDVETPLYLLLAAVACLFLITIVNTSNLTMGRAMVQAHELAVRAALGAGRARIVRHLVTESLTLAMFGGIGGLFLAVAFLRVLPALLAKELPRQSAIAFDLGPVVFTILIAMAAGVVCGAAPAFSGTRRSPSWMLGRFRSPNRFGRMLVAGEVALATMLIVVSGLLLRTFQELERVDLGFGGEDILTMEVTPVPSIYREPGERAELYRELIERFESLPPVLYAAVVHRLPLDGNSGATILVEGEATPAAGAAPAVNYRAIGGDYFRAIGMSLLQGRVFTSEETWETGGVAIINQEAAKRFWPSGGALGTRIRPSPESPWSLVVGIASNARESAIQQEPEPALYLPYARAPVPGMVLVLRASGDPAGLAPWVREVFRQVNPRQPVSGVSTLESHVDRALGAPRFHALVVTLFAFCAVLLAAIGIHGVVLRAVRARTREISVRMALGAETRRVVSLVVSEGMLPVLVGVLIGMGAAFGASSIISELTFGVGAVDVFSFVGMPFLLLAVALASNLAPALTASRVDPIETLRCL